MYKLNYDGDSSLLIEAEVSIWTNRLHIKTNSASVKRISGKAIAINDTNGVPLTVSCKGGLRKEFYINGNPVFQEEKPATTDYAAFAFPMLLIFVGGALGGLCGGFFGALAFSKCRKRKKFSAKLLIIVIMTAASWISFAVLSGVLVSVFPSLGGRA